jgi:phosphoglucosamine mutase
MKRTGRRASELTQVFEPVPQLLKNVRYEAGQDPLSSDAVKAAIASAEARLTGTGRLLIRKSGTEPLVRVMAECEDEATLVSVVDAIVDEVTAATVVRA